ncbi:D-hexose-6-phosphate mutarotase [Acinetobacter pollinis]|uniref:Putative glucose-6-phosphate 1-epimerase n=1 Tax=Acinetobacter pollinis TaxID=2605270 RepID=A0ABU6DVQ7_9GAMM|nr:D-hexose-6-phosphate mutarotase [Acinetobacter pollinis]MEB5477805.1 D-hexose-6-phosphate mutarotase [Acinetobacter pollinis]
MNIKTQKFGELDILKIDNHFCEAAISFQGAQVLSYQLKTQKGISEKLWLSDLNKYESKKAIRGGIPLCFPWFGSSPINKNYPSHGFARNILWELKEVIHNEDGHHLRFELVDNAQTREIWPFKFCLVQTIHLGQKLTIDFELENKDEGQFEYSFAWHSYFATDIFSTKIAGLKNVEYIDQLRNNEYHKQEVTDIFVQEEVDRIYPKTSGNFKITSTANSPIFIKTNAESAVVWNPWIEKSKRLNDMRDDGWKEFICLECGQIAQPISLAPKEKNTFTLEVNV